MTVKEYLCRVRDQERLLKSLEREWLEINSSIDGLKAVNMSEKVSGGKPSDLSGAVIKLENYKRKLDKEWDKLIDMRKEAKQLIYKLDNAAYQSLLIDRYINGLSWEQIAVNMRYNYRWILRMHGRALFDLEKIFTDFEKRPHKAT